MYLSIHKTKTRLRASCAQVRAIFLKFALEDSAEGGDLPPDSPDAIGTKKDGAGKNGAGKGSSMLPVDIEQDVQLIMHSQNVLCDRNHYLRIAASLWAELDALHRAGRSTQGIVAMVNKHVAPERGTRRHTYLWRALRSVIYDPLDSRSHASDGDLWLVASTLIHHFPHPLPLTHNPRH